MGQQRQRRRPGLGGREGDRYVVDGHQRLALAQRLKEQGQTPRLRAIILREKDGVTADEAMCAGAMKNLAEGGETTAIDVAKVFRRGGATEAVKAPIPPNRQAHRDGLGLLAENHFWGGWVKIEDRAVKSSPSR